MKTLVIHPRDTSTDFLSECYKNTNFTILRTWKSSRELTNAIKEHSRIIMLGHGSEYGLFGEMKGNIGFAVDSRLVYLLREKTCICVWCNADWFVHRYKLKGLFSGMIISELVEATQFRITASNESIANSNNMFANALTVAVDSKNPIQAFKDYYKSEDCEVIKFNSNNIFYKQ